MLLRVPTYPYDLPTQHRSLGTKQQNLLRVNLRDTRDTLSICKVFEFPTFQHSTNGFEPSYLVEGGEGGVWTSDG